MANIIVKSKTNVAATTEESTEKLLLNPMFRLSMSSLELFHSNFLACLFQEDPETFLKCFDVTTPNYSPQDLILYREYSLGTLNDSEFEMYKNDLKNVLPEDQKKKHVTDIAVCSVENGKEIPLLIIENKIKSYPQREQILGQTIKTNDKNTNCKKVILSLFPIHEEIFAGTGFEEVRYCKLVEKIRKFYQPNDNNFDLYMNDYCQMIDQLYICLEHYTHVPNDHTKIKFLFPLHFKELEEISFMDVYRKYQASMLYYHGLNCIKPLINGGRPSMSNKHAITSFHVELSKGQLSAGVQIEHNQFRIVFRGELIKGLLKGKKESVKLPDAITNVWQYWFGDKAMGNSRKLDDGSNNQFCSYSDDFIYRYVEIFDKKHLDSINGTAKPKSDINLVQIIETGFGKFSIQDTPLSIKNVIEYLGTNANAIVNALKNKSA